jgi:hypothetical protein
MEKVHELRPEKDFLFLFNHFFMVPAEAKKNWMEFD